MCNRWVIAQATIDRLGGAKPFSFAGKGAIRSGARHPGKANASRPLDRYRARCSGTVIILIAQDATGAQINLWSVTAETDLMI